MKPLKKLKVIIEKSETGYSAYSDQVSGIFTTGETIEEIQENIQEVIDYQIDYLKEKDQEDEAMILAKAEVEYYLDIQQFFEEFKFINVSAFAEAIGEKPGYLRKISSGIVKLSDAKSKKIQEGLHKLGREMLSIHLSPDN